ncbi:hypothetical protein LTS18_006593, partial [Coniosporium uncinatum]
MPPSKGPRELFAGPDDGPAPPFPLKLSGKVIKGFGRGSKELGIPTANIPLAGLSVGGNEDLESGIYFGWASLSYPSSTEAKDTKRSSGGEEAPKDPTASAAAQADSSTPNEASLLDKAKSAIGLDASNSTSTVSADTADSRTDGATSHQSPAEAQVYPMVMSVGWNPYYRNTVRS